MNTNSVPPPIRPASPSTKYAVNLLSEVTIKRLLISKLTINALDFYNLIETIMHIHLNSQIIL